MTQYTITIDGGTTNTRVFLWDDGGTLVAAKRRPVGVRATAEDGDNRRLCAALRECLGELMRENGIGSDSIAAIAASGMLTSNLGLVEVPHLTAPVSADDLAAGMREVCVEAVCPQPILFIPGVKNAGDAVSLANFEAMDMMRGEETETVALLEALEVDGRWLIALPGSHTKFVAVDAQRRITGCLTSITGELIAAVTHHTILADAVDRRFAAEEDYDPDLMRIGFETAARTGLGRACFSARILSQLGGEPPARLASYILGACLQSDAAALRDSAVLRGDVCAGVLVAGQGVLSQAMTDMLRHTGLFPAVRACVPADDRPLSGLGALALLRHRRQLRG